MDVDALLDRTAAAVAREYRSLDVSNAAAVLLATDNSGLAPLALELTEIDEHVGRDALQKELGMPELREHSEVLALCEALDEQIVSADDGQALFEPYWLALADQLHRILGLPVLADDVEMPIGEQASAPGLCAAVRRSARRH